MVIIFSSYHLPAPISLSEHQTAYPLHKLMQWRTRGEEKEQLYLFRLTMRINKPVFLHLFDTCANSFVFPFGRRKGGSQDHTLCFKLGTEGLQTYSFNKFGVVWILQPKTAGISVIGKYLLLSYTARNNRLNTNIRLASILPRFRRQRWDKLTAYKQNKNLSKIKPSSFYFSVASSIF